MNLTIDHLNKKYNRDDYALSDFSLSLKSGILGLIGPNGAGKSTLMKIIATISKPTSGTVLLDGDDLIKNPDHIRKVLGYLPQDFGVYENLNAFEFLQYIGALKGLGGPDMKKRIVMLLDAVNLTANARQPIKSYSGGMRQRVGIAQALLNDPKVLIMDEPTVGLDPEERVRFRDMVADIAQDCVVILSSHIVSDIESIADNIAVIQSGKLIIHGSTTDLLTIIKNKVFLITINQEEVEKFALSNLIISKTRVKDKIVIRYIGYKDDLNDAAVAAPETLEDAYFYLTRRHE